jgi:hypothetical protein
MTLSKEATDDLDALRSSAGWAILCDLARVECATRKDRGMRDATNDTNDIAALNKLRQVQAFESGVDFVLKLPTFLIEKAERGEQSAVMSPSRRGAL